MSASIDWYSVDLVVFDVDGTLYNQRRLQARMALALMLEVVRTHDLVLPRTLAAFRRRREWLAVQGTDDFAVSQYMLGGHSPERIRALVAEWIERRPLSHLAHCRYPGVDSLFRKLSERCIVAVLSDYPAVEKLAALELGAHFIVTASDVGRLKPDPSGLRLIMNRAGVPPERTLMIGDRDDRDGEAARRAGVRSLIRGRDFRTYSDPLFDDAA